MQPKKSFKPSAIAKMSAALVQKPMLVLFIYAIVAIFGLLSYTTFLKRDGFPAISIPLFVASGLYFVDDAEQVDADLAQPYSDFLLSQEEVTGVDVVSNANFATFQAALEGDVDPKAFSEKMRELNASADIPQQAQLNVIDIEPSKFFAKYNSLLSIYGGSDTDRLAAAQQLGDLLEQQPSIQLAEALEQTSSAVNPVTGESQTIKTSYDYTFSAGVTSGLEASLPLGVVGIEGDSLDIFDLKLEMVEAVSTFNASSDSAAQAVIVADFTEQINEQVGSLESNVMSGLIVVMIITLLMISWRVSILSAVFMVTVILTTVALLFIFGYTLNTITLFALILALGLFVDDATIISEAIDANKHSKGDVKQVILHAITGVGSASMSGTMTTILVFVPLLFVGGIIGEFIFLLPLTIIIALISSLVISLTLIPVLSKYSILTDSNRAKSTRPNVIAVFLERVIKMVNTNPLPGILIGVLLVAMSLGLIVGSTFIARELTFNIFPPAKDGNEIGVTVSFPGEQNSIAESQTIAESAGQIVLDEIGDEVKLISYTREFASGAQNAQLFVQLSRYQERDTTSRQFITQLEERFAGFEGAAVQVKTFDAGPPALALPFLNQYFTEDIEAVRPLLDDLADELRIADLTRPNGTAVPVTRVEVQNVQTVARTDGKRYIQLAAGFDADDTTAIVGLAQEFIEDRLQQVDLASYGLSETDVSYDFGQESDNADSFSTLGPAAILSLLVMFVLLAVQFRSVVKPLLILLALPFSLFGVTLGLYLTDNPFSFFAVIGFIGLIGIAVNNTILLTDYANQKRRAGEGIVESIAEATRERFRPLATTTLTTIAALAPLAFSDPFWQPLAVTIMFGLLSSTFLVVLAFPYYYMIAEGASVKFRGLVRKLLKRG